MGDHDALTDVLGRLQAKHRARRKLASRLELWRELGLAARTAGWAVRSANERGEFTLAELGTSRELHCVRSGDTFAVELRDGPLVVYVMRGGCRAAFGAVVDWLTPPTP